MIDALIAGTIYGQPSERTSANGKRFATAKLRVSVRDGSACFVNVICFDAGAVTALLALREGDSAALSGELTPKVWTDKHGESKPSLDLLAHAVLTPYHVTRKRAAIREDQEEEPG